MTVKIDGTLGIDGVAEVNLENGVSIDDTSGAMILKTGDVERARLTDNGSLLIGSAVEEKSKLLISRTGLNFNPSTADNSLITLRAGNPQVISYLGVNSSGLHILNAAGGDIHFGTTSAERMRLTNDGQLLIGTSISSTLGSRLNVNGSIQRGFSNISGGVELLELNNPIRTAKIKLSQGRFRFAFGSLAHYFDMKMTISATNFSTGTFQARYGEFVLSARHTSNIALNLLNSVGNVRLNSYDTDSAGVSLDVIDGNSFDIIIHNSNSNQPDSGIVVICDIQGISFDVATVISSISRVQHTTSTYTSTNPYANRP